MPDSALKPQLFERGDKLYIVSPLAPFTPGQSEIEEFAFAQDLKKMAPNDNLLWLRGNYVEAESANHNGQFFEDGDLRIKSLTPMFMPVTIMHDPRTAVGLIADVALKTPEKDKVPRSKIDTSLAIWAHRFPEVAAEVDANYKAGLLMQSMEAQSPYYTCCDCGQTFHKLPDKAERANWCEHMAKSDGWGARILGGVVFTGTGLIFGTRGATGANPNASLDVFQDEVAEYHEKAHRDTGTGKKRKRKGLKNVDTVEISKNEYDRLQAAERKLDEANTEISNLKTERDEAVAATEKAETEKKNAETAKDEAEKKVKDFEEKAQQTELASERMSALGSEFKSKLGEFTSKRLAEQAKDLSDEEWDNRLKELEEMSKVKRDAKKDGDDGKDTGNGSGSEEFSREEVASAHGGSGGGGGNGSLPNPKERRSVMAGLVPSQDKSE